MVVFVLDESMSVLSDCKRVHLLLWAHPNIAHLLFILLASAALPACHIINLQIKSKHSGAQPAYIKKYLQQLPSADDEARADDAKFR